MLIISKDKQQEDRALALSFLGKFLLFLVVFQLAVYLIHNNVFLAQSIQIAITQSVAFVYQVLVGVIIVEGNTLKHVADGQFLIVDNECTGLMLLASVSALIMAFEYPLAARVKMVVVAALLLQAENTLRIASLLFEIKQENNDFDLYHLYIWQAINFITALLVISGVKRLFGKKRDVND